MTRPIDELAELGGRLAGREFWLLEMEPTDRWPGPDRIAEDEVAQAFVDHLRWLEQLEADGRLFLSGPVDAESGLGPGLSVLNVTTRADAEAIAATEPFALAGLRTNTVRSWTVNEGSLTVNVKLFARTADIS